jgi:hypothetical protein
MSLFYQRLGAKDRASEDGLWKEDSDLVSSRLNSGTLSQPRHVTAKSGRLIWQ